MRVLITTHPAYGHLHALVPLARAAVAAGHDVAFATSRSFRPTVERAGFRAFEAGFDWLESEFEHAFPEIKALPPSSERAAWFVMNLFAGPLAKQMAIDVLALSEDWSPDVIVRDPNEYGGCIAAERLGIPHASSSNGLFPEPEMTRSLIGNSLNSARRAVGLPPDPNVDMLARYLDLAFVPRGFLDDRDWIAPTVHFFRPTPFNRSEEEERSDWLGTLPKRATVHASVGTVFNRTPDAITTLQAIIEGLRDEPFNLIVTVGRTLDPARFGSQPSNVRIEQYVPHEMLLPHCNLVVTHAGFNTLMAALTRGLPLVAVPLGADQFRNAERCANHGLGFTVDPRDRTPEAIRAAVHHVMDNSSFAKATESMRRTIAQMPGPEAAVVLLQQLANERVPLPEYRSDSAAAD